MWIEKSGQHAVLLSPLDKGMEALRRLPRAVCGREFKTGDSIATPLKSPLVQGGTVCVG